jgi:hypothetical protein
MDFIHISAANENSVEFIYQKTIGKNFGQIESENSMGFSFPSFEICSIDFLD